MKKGTEMFFQSLFHRIRKFVCKRHRRNPVQLTVMAANMLICFAVKNKKGYLWKQFNLSRGIFLPFQKERTVLLLTDPADVPDHPGIPLYYRSFLLLRYLKRSW